MSNVEASTLNHIPTEQTPDHKALWAAPLAKSVYANLLSILAILGVLTWVFAKALLYEKRLVGNITLAMDDTWIHVTVARNLVEGLGYGIVPGRFLSLSTSPTWTLLIALTYSIFRDPVYATLSVSFISMALAALVFFRLTLLFSNSYLISLSAAVLLITNPLSVWGLGSGMEIPLAILSIVALLYAYYAFEPTSRMRRIGVPILLSFAAVTRPELFALIPLALADTFLHLRFKNTDCSATKNQPWTTLMYQVFIVAVTLLPYFALNYFSHGAIFPTTYYAKTKVRGIGLLAALHDGTWKPIYRALVFNPVEQLYEVARSFLKQNIVVFLLFPVGLLAFVGIFRNTVSKRGYLLPAAIFFVPYIMGISAPSRLLSNHADRYFAVFIPLVILFAALAFTVVRQIGLKPGFLVLLALLAFLGPFRTTNRAIRLLALDADSTHRMYVKSGQWFAENLPQDTVLAVNDIGAVSYFWKRDVIDVMGLASPEIWEAIARPVGRREDLTKLKEYLRNQKVTHLLLSPLYYPKLTSDTATFEPIMEWKERYKHGRLISPQVLYKCNW